jgi:nicotinamidase-related amidase
VQQNDLKQNSQQETGLVIIDVQGNLAQRVTNATSNLANTIKLANIARVLALPTWYVEHCPAQLGATASQLLDVLGFATRLEKHRFSLWPHAEWQDMLSQSSCKHLVVCGMECHVCVYQSVIALLNAGFKVSVVSDAVASRNTADWQVGIEAMRHKGADIVSVEMIAFALMQTPGHPAFREVLTLIKKYALIPKEVKKSF